MIRLTSAQTVLKEWHDALIDIGYGVEEAAWEIHGLVREGGEAHTILQDTDFWYYLTEQET